MNQNSKNRELIALIYILLAVCGSTTVVAQELIAWKFSAGEPLRYELVQTTQIDVDAGDAGSFSTLATQTLDVVWKINEVDDEGAVEGMQQVERIQVSVTMPDGMEMAYDSADEESPIGVAAMLSPLYAALLEEEIPITVAADGELVRFEPSEETIDRITGVPATRAMGDLVAGISLRHIAQQIAFGLQPRPLEVENRVLGKMRGELIWKPAEESERNGKRYSPHLSLTIEPAPPRDDDSLVQPEPIASPEFTEQSAEGEALFDHDAGRLERLSLQLSLQITGEAIGAPVTSTIEQTIEVQYKKE